MEIDIAHLVASILGLTPEIQTTSWENLFLGITTKKDNGLVKPLADALNAAIADGSYAKVLRKWGLPAESVPKSLVNPPGLPKDKQK